MTKILAVFLWVAAALAVTAVGAGAVNLVTTQVNDPPAAPLSAEALEALPDTPSSPATVSTTTAPSSSPGTGATVPPSTTSTSSVPDDSTTTTRASTATTVPPSPSAPSAQYQSFALGVGTVLIEFVPDGILWHSATPQSGYRVEVEETGPQKVVVKFESTDPGDDRSATFEAEWKDGRLEWELDEDDD